MFKVINDILSLFFIYFLHINKKLFYSISHVSLAKIDYIISTRKYVIPPTTIAEVFRNFGSSKQGSRSAIGLNNFEYNSNFVFYGK
jgi:hypothetical protein